MSNIQFEDPYAGLELINRPRVELTGLVGFLIKKGIARDEKMANIILIASIFFCFLIIFFTLRSVLVSDSSKRLDMESIQQMKHLPQSR